MSDVHYSLRHSLVLQVEERLKLRPGSNRYKLLVLNPHRLKELGGKTVALLLGSFLPGQGYIFQK